MSSILDSKKFNEQIRKCAREHESFKVKRQCTIGKLMTLADNLDEELKKVRISNIAGSVGGIASAGLTIAGGCTIWVPAVGASLIAAGVAVGVASGVTVAGAAIGEIVNHMNTEEAFNKVLRNDKVSVQNYVTSRGTLWDFTMVVTAAGSHGPGLVAATKLASKILKASPAAFSINTVLKVVTKQAGMSIITLPLDLHALINNSVAIHNDKPAELAEELRTTARKLKDELKRLCLENDEIKASCR